MAKKTFDVNGLPTYVGFTKLHNPLFGIFTTEDFVFLLYVINLHGLRKAGCKTTRTKTTHANACNVSWEPLKDSIKRFENIGMITIVKDETSEDFSRWDYILNVPNYVKLIDIILEVHDYAQVRLMCDHFFYYNTRTINSISEIEVQE